MDIMFVFLMVFILMIFNFSRWGSFFFCMFWIWRFFVVDYCFMFISFRFISSMRIFFFFLFCIEFFFFFELFIEFILFFDCWVIFLEIDEGWDRDCKGDCVFVGVLIDGIVFKILDFFLIIFFIIFVGGGWDWVIFNMVDFRRGLFREVEREMFCILYCLFFLLSIFCLLIFDVMKVLFIKDVFFLNNMDWDVFLMIIFLFIVLSFDLVGFGDLFRYGFFFWILFWDFFFEMLVWLYGVGVLLEIDCDDFGMIWFFWFIFLFIEFGLLEIFRLFVLVIWKVFFFLLFVGEVDVLWLFFLILILIFVFCNKLLLLLLLFEFCEDLVLFCLDIEFFDVGIFELVFLFFKSLGLGFFFFLKY